VGSEAFSIAKQACDKLAETDDEAWAMILEQIPVVKSFFDQISSAILPKWSFDLTMTLAPWNEKSDWPPLLGPFNPLSLSLSISGIFGERTQRKNASWAYRSPESSIILFSDETLRVVNGSIDFELAQ
jgi:hypothetical protein